MAFDSSTPLPGAVVPDAAAADPDLPGPFAVGRWAEGFRDFLRERPRVLLIGEVVNLKRARASTYFELRDAEGAAPVAIWNNELDRLELPEGALRDGAEVVIAAGPDYYPGTATASPSFNLRATYIRLAGEGDLLAQLDRARRRLDADGLLKPRRNSRGRCCRGRSASSAPAARPPAPTCSPGSSAAAGAGPWSGRAPRSRTGARRRRSPGRWPTSPRSRRSRSRSSVAAAAASPTCGRSATRTSAARWRCCGCR